MARSAEAEWPPPGLLVAAGGLASCLEDRGFDLTGGLWSGRVLMEHPEAVAGVHAAFFAAGARVVTTASYQFSFPGLAACGVERADAVALLWRSVALACQARDEAVAVDGVSRWVAASVGPLGAARADGSEYRGRYGLSVRQLAAWHAPRLEVLAGAGADVLAIETIPDADEAGALVELLAGTRARAWLSYSIRGDRTCAGQPLSEAFAVVAGAREVVAVGVNCCDPGDVLPAIEVAKAATGKPVVVYPNSGEAWDQASRTWNGPGRDLERLVPEWVAAGARVIGGCCRVSPAQIAKIANAVATVCRPAGGQAAV